MQIKVKASPDNFVQSQIHTYFYNGIYSAYYKYIRLTINRLLKSDYYWSPFQFYTLLNIILFRVDKTLEIGYIDLSYMEVILWFQRVFFVVERNRKFQKLNSLEMIGKPGESNVTIAQMSSLDSILKKKPLPNGTE